MLLLFNTLRLRQSGRHFAEDRFKCIFLSENAWLFIIISLKFVPEGPVNNIPTLVQIMAWHQPDDRPLSELMMVSLLTHICVTRPQWVKQSRYDIWIFVTILMGTSNYIANITAFHQERSLPVVMVTYLHQHLLFIGCLPYNITFCKKDPFHKQFMSP